MGGQVWPPPTSSTLSTSAPQPPAASRHRPWPPLGHLVEVRQEEPRPLSRPRCQSCPHPPATLLTWSPCSPGYEGKPVLLCSLAQETEERSQRVNLMSVIFASSSQPSHRQSCCKNGYWLKVSEEQTAPRSKYTWSEPQRRNKFKIQLNSKRFKSIFITFVVGSWIF